MRRLSGYGPSLIVLATATLVLFAGPSAVERLTYQHTQARMIQASHQLEGENILAQLNQAYEDIAAFVEPSVVHINAQQVVPNRRGLASVSSGSGWIYDETGHVVTNYHVIKDAERIEVQLSTGELREAKLVGADKSTDIAVMKIRPGLLHPATLGDLEEPVAQGDMIFAFGSPFDFRFSMSSGIVSGVGRSVDVLGPRGYENFIQVDAAINPGNSGGPLTDFRGHVIGMNTAIATGRRNSLEEGQFAGIGLAIPLPMIEPVVSQIINNGGVVEKGLLGVVPGVLNLNEAQRYGFIGNGVLVVEVHPDFPAARAGVQVNDIVTAINGEPIGSPQQLRSIVSSMRPGETATLSLWRPDPDHMTGTNLNVDVELIRLNVLRDSGELPEDQSPERIDEIGIEKMGTCTEELASRYGVPFQPGVLVERLVEGSALAKAIEPGTIIVDVMGHPIADVDEMYTLLRLYNLRRGARVGVLLPDGTTATTLLQVDQ